MSISPLTKVLLAVHRDEQAPLLKFLQEQRTVEITEVAQEGVHAAFPELRPEDSRRLNELIALTSQIDFAITFLGPYEKKRPLLTVLSPKGPKSVADLASLAERVDVRGIIEKATSLSREISETRNRIAGLQSTVDAFTPWLGLDVPIEDLNDTPRVHQRLFMIFRVSPETVAARLDAAGDTHVLTRLAAGRNYSYYHFLCWAGDRPVYEDVLNKLGAERERLPDYAGTFREARAAVKRESTALKRANTARENDARALASQLERLRALHDYYTIQKEREQAVGWLRSSAGAVYMEGWVPVARVPSLQQGIRERFRLVEMVTFDPARGDRPPILLENRGLVRPFEIITSLYGMPDPGEFDPTPLFMLFYVVFFGLCLTDAGYGVVLSLILFFIVFRFKYSLGANKIVRVLLIGSVSTIVLGAITGGWFGDLLARLPAGSRLKDIGTSIKVFDPLKDTITFMLLCLALGFIQVNLGMIVGLVKLMKNKEYRGGLVKLSWIVLVNAAAVLVADYISTDGIPRWGTTAAAVCLPVASVQIVLFSRPEKNIIARLLWGLYSLYGCTGFLGDILSYLRLLALGLSTGIIATVVNLVATLVGGIPYVGMVLSVIVFIGGHTFNIAINCLGAFVHTTRLQYVEFFTKFYDGTGRPFRPFGISPKYVYLKEAIES